VILQAKCRQFQPITTHFTDVSPNILAHNGSQIVSSAISYWRLRKLKFYPLTQSPFSGGAGIAAPKPTLASQASADHQQ
jgi:hypothetical protein